MLTIHQRSGPGQLQASTLAAGILFGVFLVVWRPVIAREKSVEMRNKALVQKSFDAWRAGTGSPFELLSDDATWTITGKSVVSKTYLNKEDFLHTVIRPFNARMEGHLVPTVRGIYADHATVVIYFDADGTALDHKPYHNSYAWFFNFEGDKVRSAVAFFDSIEFNELWKRVEPKSTPASP